MLSRTEYFRDLLSDCETAAKQVGVNDKDLGAVIAALVLSDSYNGLRKALLQVDTLRHTPIIQPRQN
jgi:hypothetical protein